MEMVNLGMIGLNVHSEGSHLRQLEQIPEAHFMAFADEDLNRLHQMWEYYGPNASATQKWQEVATHPDVDAVYIATADDLHATQLLSALTAGKHAFVEQPLANTWENYTELRECLSSAPKDLIISTCHPRRFDPPFINTKQLLNNHLLLAEMFHLPGSTDYGPVTRFTFNSEDCRPGSPGKYPNFGFDQLPHEIDTAADFFGESGLEYAISHTMNRLAFDVEARREDGIELRFIGNRLQGRRKYQESWQVDFIDGPSLSVNAYTGEIRLSYGGEQIAEPQKPTNAAGDLLFKTDHDKRLMRLNTHFIHSIQNKDEHPPYVSRRQMLMNTVLALVMQDVETIVAIPWEGLIMQP